MLNYRNPRYPPHFHEIHYTAQAKNRNPPKLWHPLCRWMNWK